MNPFPDPTILLLGFAGAAFVLLIGTIAYDEFTAWLRRRHASRNPRG